MNGERDENEQENGLGRNKSRRGGWPKGGVEKGEDESRHREGVGALKGELNGARGLILGRGFVPVSSSFAVKSLGLGV